MGIGKIYPKVAVGVCTYNRSKDLKRLLESLQKLDYLNYKIIVVDNNSTDNTKKIAESFDNVKYVTEKNQGLAYARNRLIDSCEDDIEYLGILDDDETVNPDWIDRMLECMFSNKKIVAVGGQYIPILPKSPPAWTPMELHAYNLNEKGCKYSNSIGIPGGNAMVNLKIVRERNVRFNVELGYRGGLLLSGEDNDFFDKLVGPNDLRGFTEFAPVYHYIPASKMTFKWFLKRYFFEGVTQYYRFGKKIYFKNALQLPLRTLRFLITLFTFNKKRIADRFFKLIHNIGVVIAPIVISINSNK